MHDASLPSQAGGYGNLMLTLEQQEAFTEEAPEIFLPIPGGLGKNGTDAYSPGGGERRCTERRTPNRVKTASRAERKAEQEKGLFRPVRRSSR